MKRQAGIRESTPDTNVRTVLSLLTDLIFVSIAALLLLNYARVILTHEDTLLFLGREGLLILYLLMALVLLVFRNDAKSFTARKVEYGYTIVGFSSPLFFQPTIQNGFFLFSAILEFIGLLLVASAFVSLGRSFGLAPENRGIRTIGAYRLVRHPMYLGYILAEAGYALGNLSSINCVVFTVSVAFLLLRLRVEERLLLRDQAYQRYATRVRWRLVPLVF